MTPKSIVEIADVRSRRRALGFAIATLVFVVNQVIARPAFGTAEYDHGWRMYVWALNIALLLLCVGTGGGLLNSTQIRALINDEVSRSNYRTACSLGFWIAMVIGLAIFVVPDFQSFTGKEAVYLVVTPATVVTVLIFCWLEYRAHADA